MTERAFVIHVSPYLEHGALVTLLCESGGRVTAVSRKGGTSYPEFTECEAVLREGRSMPALRELDPAGPFTELRGSRLFCGMYMNELVFRLTGDRSPATASSAPMPGRSRQSGAARRLTLRRP